MEKPLSLAKFDFNIRVSPSICIVLSTPLTAPRGWDPRPKIFTHIISVLYLCVFLSVCILYVCYVYEL